MDTLGIPVSDRTPVHMPIEIIEQIIDQLDADQISLQNCALVCKSWTPSCRSYIFYHVVFQSQSSDFLAWQRTFSATADGPHHYTRKLTVPSRYFERKSQQQLNDFAAFLQHWFLFTKVQYLYISGNVDENILDSISIHDIFGHLSGTLRLLSILETRCSPQAMISLVALFQHLERLNLMWILFESSQSPPPLPERRTFKGTFDFSDWRDSSEEFVTLLSEHDLQYHEMCVSTECWLQDTVWNKCLAKCADHLEELSIIWARAGALIPHKYKIPTFKKLRKLSIETTSACATILPPPEFLSSIVSTQLSEVIIDCVDLPSRRGTVQAALDAIGSYDEALRQLSNQLKSSSRGEKLVLKLKVRGKFPVSDATLPQFSEEGDLKILRRFM